MFLLGLADGGLTVRLVAPPVASLTVAGTVKDAHATTAALEMARALTQHTAATERVHCQHHTPERETISINQSITSYR